MGNQPTRHQEVPIAIAVPLVCPIATAYPQETFKQPEGRQRDGGLRVGEMERDLILRQQFMEDKNKLLGNKIPVPSAPPLEEAPFNNRYEIYSDRIAGLEKNMPKKNYFENHYERALREGIDRCYVALVRDYLKSGKLDKIEILNRELDYLNEALATHKAKKNRLKIKEMIEERIRIVLNKI